MYCLRDLSTLGCHQRDGKTKHCLIILYHSLSATYKPIPFSLLKLVVNIEKL